MLTALTFDDLLTRARGLAATGPRRLLGITGAPGSGKSTLAAALADALGPVAAFVPMDGFHLANAVLHDLNRRDRKGAPDTFDVAGYTALLQRLRVQPADVSDAEPESTVYAPTFDRALDASIGSALPIRAHTPLIITEGNYLLTDTGGWQHVRAQLDEVWFLEPAESVRQQRLIRRHEDFGKSPTDARAWALGTDQRNAELVAATRSAATLIVTLID